ncbi:hypothetical protein LTR36_004723 [Oleoguttula mirabilis]|uniref:F-box domain-containing protein n=1 Tax=Oleoguttula mirabilis TaxID=1507867 RepID=A0AAV9JFF5_9PEZI|nr:hypothetical protein LTR36_004723 [Oleoguttula mirabilis]
MQTHSRHFSVLIRPSNIVKGSSDMVKLRSATRSALEAAANAVPSTATPDPSYFRFLDLPGEIRNSIYSYTFPGIAGIYSRDLADFKDPPITAVSRQVRKETLPLLFAEFNFKILVGTDLAERTHDQDLAPHQRMTTSTILDRTSNAGILGIRRSVMKFLQESGAAAAFRDITFVVCEVGDVQALRYRLRMGTPATMDGNTCGLLRITASARSFSWTFWRGRAFKGAPNLRCPLYASKAVDAAVSDAVAIARELANRVGLIGFTVKDLQAIAMGFRFQRERAT